VAAAAAQKAKRTYKPADERREQILDCALEVFASKGYHGASIADVCTRARIGRATLYQYFDDKRDVLAALADRIARRVTDAVATRKPVVLPPGAIVTEVQSVRFVEHRFLDILQVVFDDARTVRLVLRAGRGADGVVDQILDQIDRAVLGLVEADLAAAVTAGVVRPCDVRFVARFFLGGLEKICLGYLDDDRPIDLRAIAREGALLEMCGIYARRPDPSAPAPVTPVPAGPNKEESR
jgi:AcrR family transcriptional regulator